MNYYLQCNCSENSKQNIQCSGRRGRQNESWLSVCTYLFAAVGFSFLQQLMKSIRWCFVFCCVSESAHSTVNSQLRRSDEDCYWTPRVGRTANYTAESSWQVERSTVLHSAVYSVSITFCIC